VAIEKPLIDWVGNADSDLVAVRLVDGKPIVLTPLAGTVATGPVMLRDTGESVVLTWDLILSRP